MFCYLCYFSKELNAPYTTSLIIAICPFRCLRALPGTPASALDRFALLEVFTKSYCHYPPSFQTKKATSRKWDSTFSRCLLLPRYPQANIFKRLSTPLAFWYVLPYLLNIVKSFCVVLPFAFILYVL